MYHKALIPESTNGMSNYNHLDLEERVIASFINTALF